MVRVLRRHLSLSLAGAVLALPSPVLSGDWPDPSFIRDGGENVAVSTSGGWAPIVRMLRSQDLRAWRLTNSVFLRAPRWVRNNFWAPELTKLGSGYAVFYGALPRRKRGWYCLGVATAPTLDGPWLDAGRPLRCGRLGSIDPFAVRDEQGRLNLLWKEDGNEFGHATPIYAQRLREDGRRLLGRPRELMRATSRWERGVVEAPAVIRRDGFFYLFYSANLCCTKRCAYAVGVARSPTLLGRWRKYPGNPILRGGNGWRCPGHTSVADDGDGGYRALFHAYRAGEERLAGRQVLAAPVTFGADGWPAIGDGRPPAPGPAGARTGFAEDFSAPALAPEWEWPLQRVPGIAVGDGLALRAPRRGAARLDGAVLSRRIGTAGYTATAVVDRDYLLGEWRAGVSAYRSGFEAIGVATGRRRAVVWQRRNGKFRVLASAPVPASPLVHLRMIARGPRFRFEISPDGVAWRPVGRTVRGPVEESARLALTAGGARLARGRFVSTGLIDG